jgi:hypothetical protein
MSELLSAYLATGVSDNVTAGSALPPPPPPCEGCTHVDLAFLALDGSLTREVAGYRALPGDEARGRDADRDGLPRSARLVQHVLH